MKNKFLIIVAVVAAAAGLAAFFLYTKTAPSDTRGPAVAQAPTPGQSKDASRAQANSGGQFVRFHSPSFGNKDAKVVVVEWLDPECEGCRAMHPPVKKIILQYRDRVHFVVRYIPFHKNSLYAAAVLEEAREFGKFEEALDIIFARQPEWGSHSAPRPDLIPTYLKPLGIPPERLDPAHVIPKHRQKIKIDEEDGLKVGVRVTPSFFINGQPLPELGEEQLRAAIEKALRASK